MKYLIVLILFLVFSCKEQTIQGYVVGKKHRPESISQTVTFINGNMIMMNHVEPQKWTVKVSNYKSDKVINVSKTTFDTIKIGVKIIWKNEQLTYIK